VSSTPAATRRRRGQEPVDNPCSSPPAAVSVRGPVLPDQPRNHPRGRSTGGTALFPGLSPQGRPRPVRRLVSGVTFRTGPSPQPVDNCVDARSCTSPEPRLPAPHKRGGPA
jgi:hypothetical protein